MFAPKNILDTNHQNGLEEQIILYMTDTSTNQSMITMLWERGIVCFRCLSITGTGSCREVGSQQKSIKFTKTAEVFQVYHDIASRLQSFSGICVLWEKQIEGEKKWSIF